jgi:GTPase-associated protein 1
VVRVDQLVFGYREGHELLAGSIKVEPRLQLELLPHADARFEDDSPHYLVGLALADLERFMLVRIWPAPELPRPGAVWAHALLLDQDAAESLDPVRLVDSFRRPTVDSLSTYREPLFALPSGPTRVEAPLELMISLCLLAYRRPSRDPVVIWEGLTQSETALLALWRNLPANARWRCSFRTRGQARAGNSPYTLQVAARFGGRSPSGEIELWDPRELAASSQPNWVSAIALASLDPDDPLSRPIRDVAVNVKEAVQLAELWPQVHEENASRVLSSLEADSEASASQSLVQALFASPGRGEQVWNLSEGARVQALLHHGGRFASALLPAKRLDSVWRDDHQRMVGLFDSRDELDESSRHLLLMTGADQLMPEELIARVVSPGILELIAETHPDLFTTSELWEAVEQSANDQLMRRALAAGSKVLPDKQLVRVLLAAEAWQCLVLGLESDLPVALLAAEMAREHPLDAERWMQVFAARWLDLLSYLTKGERVRPEALVLGAATMDLNNLNEVSWRRWVIASRELHPRDDDVAIRAAGRLLSASLHASGESARKVLIDSFGPVQSAIEDGRIDQETAALLSASLPKRKWKNLNDRLARALIESMESSDWSRKDLERALGPAGGEVKSTLRLVPKKNRFRRAMEAKLEDVLTIGR